VEDLNFARLFFVFGVGEVDVLHDAPAGAVCIADERFRFQHAHAGHLLRPGRIGRLVFALSGLWCVFHDLVGWSSSESQDLGGNLVDQHGAVRDEIDIEDPQSAGS